MNLEERLYTSTEVAEILGVSLRSVYRYLEEGKLNAEMKTATGRLRFTKNDIMEFLKPQVSDTKRQDKIKYDESKDVGDKDVKKSTSVEPSVSIEKEVQEESISEAESLEESVSADESVAAEDSKVDWLQKFRQSAQKYKEQKAIDEEEVDESGGSEEVSGLVEAEGQVAKMYYHSSIGGLKDIAQNVDKIARRSSLPYAFTNNAGLSLHRPLKKPFSILHVYVRHDDKDLFEKALELSPASKPSAQLCLYVTPETDVFQKADELHGLFVVSKDQLKSDLLEIGEEELAAELN